MKLKITIVTGPFLSIPPAPCGAVERVWHQLGKEFVKRGHEVTILCRNHSDLRPADQEYRVRRLFGFRRSSRVPWNVAMDFVYACHALARLPRADILVTNTFWLPVLAARLSHWVGKVHVNIARMPKGQMRLYGLAGVDRLAAISTSVKDAVLSEYPEGETLVRVLPYPVATEVFRESAETRDYTGERVLLYAGRIHPEKGLHLLLKAFRLLNRSGKADGIKLSIVGPWEVEDGGGGAGYMKKLRRLAQGLNVEFLPPVWEREDFCRQMHAAHYFCYPSLAETGETFGVAPLEAMATGLPTLTSNLSAFREFLEPGENGFVFDHRTEKPHRALAEGLSQLFALTPEQALKFGKRAADCAKGFSVSHIADMYLNDFQELAGAVK